MLIPLKRVYSITHNAEKDKTHILRKGLMDHFTKAYPILSRTRGWRGFQSMVASLRVFSKGEVAQQRLKIIKFYEKHREEDFSYIYCLASRETYER